MHAISSYRGNRPTNTQTDRGDYNSLHCAAASLARSVMNGSVAEGGVDVT